ncbi:MAG: hypothetical protein FJ335_04615, partial [Sphingomonadales bacterium]|nr:hypothetical protein [Sphingomonadales bacterium]
MPLTATEAAAVTRAGASPMLARTLAWSEVNSGTGNLDGLAHVAALLADAFASLPGEIALVDPTRAE